MNEKELIESIKNEMESCDIKIHNINIEISRLQGKKEELDDRKTMLFSFLN